GEFNSAIHDSLMNPKYDPFIIMDLNSVKSVIGLKYTAPTESGFFRKKMASSAIKQFKIEVSQDGSTWTTVNTGTFKLDPKKPTEMIYFGQDGVLAGSQLNTYDVQFVKLTALKASVIGVAELELVGPPGDNIEIGVSTDDVHYENGLGLLAEDYVYQPDDLDTPDVNEEQKIPKGSVVITGEYRGNPAFNVPLVLNEDELHIADEYHGILLAQLPSEGQLEEITEGTWIYWVEPEFVDQFMQNKLIFAELYRTDSADLSTGGQRFTSDTFNHEVPEVLPSISFTKMKLKSNVVVTEIEPK
ncbi:MAG: fibronectin type III domain-containing protein, partial [Turicibacter sp.]